jgi:hypothetical protein
MGSFDNAFVEQLKGESWGLYSAGALLIILRM